MTIDKLDSYYKDNDTDKSIAESAGRRHRDGASLPLEYVWTILHLGLIALSGAVAPCATISVVTHWLVLRGNAVAVTGVAVHTAAGNAIRTSSGAEQQP